jgi:predicted aspartyl protease
MRYTIPVQMLLVDNEGCHLMISGIINNYKVHFLIDTGATLTVMDLGRMKKIFPGQQFDVYQKFFMGIGTGDIEPWSFTIGVIDLCGLKIKNKEVVLIDMSAINKAYAAFDLPRIDGVIGGDILKEYKALIDYANSTLDLNDH